MNKTEKSASCGNGFVMLLTLLFIALKLTEQIDWSWVWVLSPIWISLSLMFFGLVAGAVIVVAAATLRPKLTPEQEAVRKATRACRNFSNKLREKR